jgi:hypothetical protein
VASRLALVTLAIPPALLAVLLAFPALDKPWGTFSFHFYVVSAAALMSAGVCLVLIISARTMRETRIMFLALAFLALSMFFAVHGLATPGFIFDEPYASLERSPWLSTLAAGVFAALSVSTIPFISHHSRLARPEAVFGVCASIIGGYFAVSLVSPDWLAGFPTQEEWFQHFLTVATIGLLAFAAWRYYQSYMFARLPGQLAVAVGLVFLGEAQLSLDFGLFWNYSWWLYHALFPIAFGTVLFGWTWELIRTRDGKSIADGLAMRDALVQLNRGRPTDLVLLADEIENHDRETSRHVDRVAALSFAIGQELGFSAARLRDLVLAAQMHDVGKIGIPSHILAKPGKLSELEWAVIRQHPDKGWEIARRAHGLTSLASVIRHHHERFDGTGYPDALKGENIPLESRIIAVADTFDALTCDRPYRRAMTLTEALAEIERVAGSQLDPNLTGILLRLMPGADPQAAPVTGDTDEPRLRLAS